MPEPLSTERIAEIKASIERAHTEIGEVCSEGPRNRFRMSIPANPGRDTDLIVSEALEGAEDLLAEVERLNALVKCLRSEAEREEQTTGNLIDERDNFHALLDRFAAAVAPIDVIGEHSSGNDPWLNALDMVTPAVEVDRLRAQVSLMGTYLQRESMAALDRALAERMAGQ